MNPLGNKVGGISTFLKNFVKYAPESFNIRWIGITTAIQKKPLLKWNIISLNGRKIEFLPLMYQNNENRRERIPLVLRFSFRLFVHRKSYCKQTKGSILNFNRIETAIPFIFGNNKKFLTIHGHSRDHYNPHSEVKWNKMPGLYFLLERLLIHKFEKIYIVRKDAVNHYLKKYKRIAGRVEFLPTWVDKEVFYPFATKIEKDIHKKKFLAKNGYGLKDKLILFAGRFEGQKDPILLIRSFKKIYEEDNSARLLLVGYGKLEQSMRDFVSSIGLSSRVNFLGVLSQDKLAALMRVSDVFLMTSAFEGMPRSVMESLGSGLPVVTTNAGEVNLVVHEKKSGKIVFDNTPQVIADAVLGVLNSGDINNARQSVESYFADAVLERVYNAMSKSLQVKNICIVCSSGGHLWQAVQLMDILNEHRRVWVSFKKGDAESLLINEEVVWGYYPTQRNLLNLFRNTIVALKVFYNYKTDVVISTGAGVAIPFCVLGKITGKKVIFIESFSRITAPSLTGRIAYHFADNFFIQWESLKKFYPKADYMGKLL